MKKTAISLHATSPDAATLTMLALAACYFVWGSTYLAIRFALESFPPFWQMGTRFVLAGTLLLGWMRWRGIALPTARQWAHAAVIGTLMLALGMGLVAVASQYVGSGLIATFIAVVPLVVCAWGLLFGRRPSPMELLGMAVGLGGVLLLARGGSFAAAPAGLAAMTGAVLAWSLGSVLATTRLPLAPGVAGFASEMLCGGAVLLAVSLALGEQPAWPPTPRALAAWAYLTLFGSLVAFSAYLYLLAHASPALATSYAFVNPVIALLLGVALGGERVAPGEWGASGVVLAGVLLILHARRRPSPTEKQQAQT